ncbi:unnamed protein product, partial [Meganyctiphanes norvegica]
MESKKNKKQSQKSATNGHMDNAQIDLQSQKKKKKKNKEKKENDEEIKYSISQQSSLEVEDSLSKKKKKKREQQEVEESPRKKKKTNMDEEYTAIETTVQKVDAKESTPRSKKIKKEQSEKKENEGVLDENWWPPEERTSMLEAMKSQIPNTGRFTRVGYLSLLRKTNWEEVVSAVNNKTEGNIRSVEQCQEQFHKLLNKVGTIKSLSQILDEALSLATDPGALRREVTQARHRFIREYMSKHKGDKDCTIMAATRIWTNLPAEEKAVWEEEYQNELRQKGLVDVKSKAKKLQGPENSKFPFEFYQSTRAAKGEELSSADAKAKYTSLSLKKRIPFIAESLKQQKVYEAKAAKYLENNPTWKKTRAHGPTVKEVKDYLESLGMPLAPPNSVIGMYYLEEKERFTEDNENDSAKVRSVNESLRPFARAREALSKLPKDQQDRYKSEWRKSWNEYLSEVEKWKPMIEEKYPEIMEQAFAALAEVKGPKNVAETSEKAPVRRKGSTDPLPHIERRASSLTNVKFTDEPPLPARTAYELFQQKFKRDAGANYTAAKAKEFWGRMSDDKKAVYTDRVGVLQQRSKNNFLSFARNLEKPQRKLFVGVKRAKLIKYFQEDIFEEEYPGGEYPILIAATPKKDGSTGQIKETDLSEDDFQPSNSSIISKKGGIKALAAKMKKETVKEESSEEEKSEEGDEEEEDDDDEDEEEDDANEEKEDSSSDSESSDSDSESNSEVEASQPTPVSPFSQAKSGKNSSRLSNVANSSPFSGKLPSKEESSDSGSDSDEESDSDDNKENCETPVSSRVQSKTNQVR